LNVQSWTGEEISLFPAAWNNGNGPRYGIRTGGDHVILFRLKFMHFDHLRRDGKISWNGFWVQPWDITGDLIVSRCVKQWEFPEIFELSGFTWCKLALRSPIQIMALNFLWDTFWDILGFQKKFVLLLAAWNNQSYLKYLNRQRLYDENSHLFTLISGSYSGLNLPIWDFIWL